MPQTPPRSIRLALRWLNSPLLRLACSMNRRFAAASASATMCSDLVAIARHALPITVPSRTFSGRTQCKTFEHSVGWRLKRLELARSALTAQIG